MASFVTVYWFRVYVGLLVVLCCISMVDSNGLLIIRTSTQKRSRMCVCQQLSRVLLFGWIEPWRHIKHRESLQRSEFNMFFATGYHSRSSTKQRALRRHRKANSRSKKLAKSLYVTQCSISETWLTHAHDHTCDTSMRLIWTVGLLGQTELRLDIPI